MQKIMRDAKKATHAVLDNINKQASIVGDTVSGAVNNVRQK